MFFKRQDVHDRALLYYRLLRHDVETAQRVVSSERPVCHSFSDAGASELLNALFEEFNTASVSASAPPSPSRSGKPSVDKHPL